MARFRFQLEPVLRQRRMEEEARQRDVAKLERERLALEGSIRDRQRAIEFERSAWRESAGAGVVQVAALRQQAAAASGERGRAQRSAIELAGVLQRLKVARGALIEATARRRAIELLRESQYEDWRRGQAKVEAGENDDMVVMRHGRGGGAQ